MLVIPLCVQATREHCSMRLLLWKKYLSHLHKIIHLPVPVGFGTTKWLGFLCLTSTPLKPRVWLFFLTKGQCCPSIKGDKRVRFVKRVLYWTVSEKEYRVLMLWLKPLVLDRRRTLYRIYTRELDRELCAGLSTLYTNT